MIRREVLIRSWSTNPQAEVHTALSVATDNELERDLAARTGLGQHIKTVMMYSTASEMKRFRLGEVWDVCQRDGNV